jgi:hypothetical protein
LKELKIKESSKVIQLTLDDVLFLNGKLELRIESQVLSHIW